MSKISKMNMGEQLKAHPNVVLNTYCWGWLEKATYLPTGSRLKAHFYKFSRENGEKWRKVLLARPHDLEHVVETIGKIPVQSIGNMRLEVCVSRDAQLLALQLFQYAGYDCEEVTNVVIFEGEKALLVYQLLQP